MSSPSITSLFRSWDWSPGLIVELRLLDVLDTDFLFGGGVWGGVVMMGEDEVLANELGWNWWSSQPTTWICPGSLSAGTLEVWTRSVR
jgi:hypothetical protein